MKYILTIGIVLTMLSGCYYDNIDELHPESAPCDTTGTVSFANDILPIMQHSCGSQNNSCHNTDGSSSGYGLDNYTDVTNTISNSGIFLETIVHSSSVSASKWMPKGTTAKIDDCSIQKITAWMNRGTPNN
ncbi:MAG: hypothetical protein IPP51_07860 [Bacteroidetes bacterium]|nr:hypothetical protein [Bacteroidota bacterium]